VTYFVQYHEGEDFLIPLGLYDRVMHLENMGYMIFFIINPLTGKYAYAPITGHHRLKPDIVYIPKKLYNELGYVSRFTTKKSKVLLQDCFRLRKVKHLTVKPVEKEWYQLPESATPEIKNKIISYLEKLYVLKIGDLIPVTYNDVQYTLSVRNLLTLTDGGKAQILAGIVKDTSVDFEII
jgi:hypothetical protein